MPLYTDHARWFSEEVDPHRGALRAYVQHTFPDVRDADDVIQDSLLRIWTARASRQIVTGRWFHPTTGGSAAVSESPSSPTATTLRRPAGWPMLRCSSPPPNASTPCRPLLCVCFNSPDFAPRAVCGGPRIPVLIDARRDFDVRRPAGTRSIDDPALRHPTP